MQIFLICFLNIFCQNRVKSWVTIRKLHVWMCGGLTFIPCSRKITGLTVSWDWPALLRKIPTSGFSLSQNNSIRVNSTLGLEVWMKIDTALLHPLLSYMYICPFICRAILEKMFHDHNKLILFNQLNLQCLALICNWTETSIKHIVFLLTSWSPVHKTYCSCAAVLYRYSCTICSKYVRTQCS